MNRKLFLILPIVSLLFLAVLLAKGLQSDPRKLESKRVGKPDQHRLPMVGLAYKDKTSDTVNWLKQHGGNPYDIIAVDLDGRVGIEYGVYGVPETFVIDSEGKVRMRHAGPVDDAFIAQHVEPLLAASNVGNTK